MLGVQETAHIPPLEQHILSDNKYGGIVFDEKNTVFFSKIPQIALNLIKNQWMCLKKYRI